MCTNDTQITPVFQSMHVQKESFKFSHILCYINIVQVTQYLHFTLYTKCIICACRVGYY